MDFVNQSKKEIPVNKSNFSKGVGNVLSMPFPNTNENEKAPVIW